MSVDMDDKGSIPVDGVSGESSATEIFDAGAAAVISGVLPGESDAVKTDVGLQAPVLWNRNFIQCCVSYFLMNFAFYLLMPSMPLYLVEQLGVDASRVGMVLSSYTIGLLCVRPLSGYIVDCFSRKRLYLLSFAAFAAMFAGYLFAAAVVTLMLVRFVQGGFMGLTSVSGNTIAIDVIPSPRRGEGMGFYGLTINLAMSLSPLISVWIYDSYGFGPLVLSGMATACAGVLSVSLIRYPARAKVPKPKFSLDRFVLVKALPSALAYMLVAIPYGMVVSFVVLYGREIGVADAGYFFIFMAVGVGMARLVSGRLVDRGKIHHVSLCALTVLAVSYAVFGTVHAATAFFACAFAIGVGFGVSVPAFQCLFVNVAPHHMRGTATSTYLTSFDLGVGAGMLVAGFIAQRFGLATAYMSCTLFCLLSLLVYVRMVIPSYRRNKLDV